MIALSASGIPAFIAVLLGVLSAGYGTSTPVPDSPGADNLDARLLVALICAAQI
jgi:hypothetical protein